VCQLKFLINKIVHDFRFLTLTHSDAEKTKADCKKTEEARTEHGWKNKAERTSPNNYIYKQNKAEFIKGTKPKGCSTLKKAIKLK